MTSQNSLTGQSGFVFIIRNSRWIRVKYTLTGDIKRPKKELFIMHKKVLHNI